MPHTGKVDRKVGTATILSSPCIVAVPTYGHGGARAKRTTRLQLPGAEHGAPLLQHRRHGQHGESAEAPKIDAKMTYVHVDYSASFDAIPMKIAHTPKLDRARRMRRIVGSPNTATPPTGTELGSETTAAGTIFDKKNDEKSSTGVFTLNQGYGARGHDRARRPAGFGLRQQSQGARYR